MRLDLADQESVQDFATWLPVLPANPGRGLDILINNAAIMACPETRVGPGWESQFATNHLGHYALTNLLWPALVGRRRGAGWCRSSSTGHKLSAIRFDDINFDTGYDKWKAYGQAKTANALFAVELDRLGGDSGVRAFAVHPGGIMTELQRHLPREEMVAAGWMDEHGNRPGGVQDPGAGSRHVRVGRHVAAAGRARAGCTARTATSPSPPTRTPAGPVSGASMRTPSILQMLPGCGRLGGNDRRQRLRLTYPAVPRAWGRRVGTAAPGVRAG